jgi:hypothetical protein
MNLAVGSVLLQILRGFDVDVILSKFLRKRPARWGFLAPQESQPIEGATLA